MFSFTPSSHEPDAVADGVSGADDVLVAVGEERQKVTEVGLAGVELV